MTEATTNQTNGNTAKKTLVAISQGFLEFKNQQELADCARNLMAMKAIVPDHLKKEGFEAVMSALLMCKQLNLPYSNMNNMAYFKGKLTVYGNLITALAERHPAYGEKEEFFVDENFDQICVANKNLKAVPWAAVMRVRKLGMTTWNEYFFSVDDAEQAGLLTKQTKPDSGWIKYTKDLLMHKVKNRAMNGNYASAIHGVVTKEDVIEDENNIRDVNGSIADEANKLFGEGDPNDTSTDSNEGSGDSSSNSNDTGSAQASDQN